MRFKVWQVIIREALFKVKCTSVVFSQGSKVTFSTRSTKMTFDFHANEKPIVSTKSQKPRRVREGPLPTFITGARTIKCQSDFLFSYSFASGSPGINNKLNIIGGTVLLTPGVGTCFAVQSHFRHMIVFIPPILPHQQT